LNIDVNIKIQLALISYIINVLAKLLEISFHAAFVASLSNPSGTEKLTGKLRSGNYQ
jgi:hypothetical protein